MCFQNNKKESYVKGVNSTGGLKPSGENTTDVRETRIKCYPSQGHGLVTYTKKRTMSDALSAGPSVLSRCAFLGAIVPYLSAADFAVCRMLDAFKFLWRTFVFP